MSEGKIQGKVIGKVVAINISDKKGVPKITIPEGEFVENHGLAGDAHAGNWHRQVSLLGIESINKMTESGIKDLGAGKFAENLTTEGIELWKLPVGTRLKIGETLQEVTQIGKECHTKCAIFQKVGSCVMPTEGIFTRVLKGGIIRPGDEISLV